ncbi:hypothetical protein CEXT_7651 [Caerostris extrusa]|uniref:Uncharacterized protein n=1 Tax=Caerostris extrusa TaxID=172846 RepID=A0AAV4XQB8_CAEEX|nr:hypothetical protein CEXT_7651 [Caerostris extrusa]
MFRITAGILGPRFMSQTLVWHQCSMDLLSALAFGPIRAVSQTQISLLAIIRSLKLTLEVWFTHLEQKPVPEALFLPWHQWSTPLFNHTANSPPFFAHLVKLSNPNKFEQWLSTFPRPEKIACIWRLLEQYTRYQLRELWNKETQISLLAIIRTRELGLEDWFTHLETKSVPKPSFYCGISGPLLYPITLQNPPLSTHLVKLSNANKFGQWLSKFPRPGS